MCRVVVLVLRLSRARASYTHAVSPLSQYNTRSLTLSLTHSLTHSRFAMPACLENYPTDAWGPAVCGDGLREVGEDCDCGAQPCSTVDPCCDDATCTLKAGAACSVFDEVRILSNLSYQFSPSNRPLILVRAVCPVSDRTYSMISVLTTLPLPVSATSSAASKGQAGTHRSARLKRRAPRAVLRLGRAMLPRRARGQARCAPRTSLRRWALRAQLPAPRQRGRATAARACRTRSSAMKPL